MINFLRRIFVYNRGSQWLILKYQQRKFSVGTVACDCRTFHMRIIALDGDMATMEDGFTCDIFHCLDKVPHPGYEHD